MRAFGAAVLFWLTGLIFVREKVQKKDLKRLFLLAIFGVCINQMLFLKGLDMTSSINAAIMMITTPILVLILAALVIKEKITVLKLAGILLGFLGAGMLMYSANHAKGGQSDALGDLFILLNATSWGLYLVLVKPMMLKYHTITILKWVFLFGSFLVLPFGIMEVKATDFSSFAWEAWRDIGFIIIGTTFVAYLLNTYALKALSPSVVSAYIYLQPILTAALALYLGKDQLDVFKVLSALCIFTGVYLVSVNRNSHQKSS